jgi:hypothetical protein
MGDKSASMPGFDLALAEPKKSGDVLGPIPLFHDAYAMDMNLCISHGGMAALASPFMRGEAAVEAKRRSTKKEPALPRPPPTVSFTPSVGVVIDPQCQSDGEKKTKKSNEECSLVIRIPAWG